MVDAIQFLNEHKTGFLIGIVVAVLLLVAAITLGVLKTKGKMGMYGGDGEDFRRMRLNSRSGFLGAGEGPVFYTDAASAEEMAALRAEHEREDPTPCDFHPEHKLCGGSNKGTVIVPASVAAAMPANTPVAVPASTIQKFMGDGGIRNTYKFSNNRIMNSLSGL